MDAFERRLEIAAQTQFGSQESADADRIRVIKAQLEGLIEALSMIADGETSTPREMAESALRAIGRFPG